MQKLMLFIAVILVSSMGAQAQLSAFGGSEGLNIASTAAPAKIEWKEARHDFGEIPQGTPVTCTFTFTNTGDQDLVISKVKPSCGCTAADFTKEAIAPGETGYIKATYNASAIGVFQKSITVTSNAEPQIEVLRILGTVQK